MTYETARAQIVTLVQSATPTILEHGMPSTFIEAPDASDDNLPRSRSFWLFGVRDVVRVPLSSTRRRVVTLDLVIAYELLANRKALDRVLRSDHKAVGDALLDPSTWDRPTSGIVSVEQAGGALILEATIDDALEGFVLHRYTFDLEYLS